MLRNLYLQVENNPGVLARISGLFSGKGYNLEGITAGITTDPTIFRITLVCNSTDAEFEQIKKQLNRLIDVIKVIDLTNRNTIKKELAFIKVAVTEDQRSDIFNLVNAYGYKANNVSLENLIIEITDSPEKINHFIALLQSYRIIEVARSGLVVMEYDLL